MLRRLAWSALAAIGVLGLYLAAWPVPIEPVAWQAPPNPGYSGSFAQNTRLEAVERLDLGGLHGPEDVAVDAQGRLYASTAEGWIVRLQPDGSHAEPWVSTGGRPLGLDFDAAGRLVVADAFRGLLSIAADGTVTQLAAAADGVPIRYADDVDVAKDGRIYFSDASVKFGAQDAGNTLAASLLDLMEHGGHGRLLVFDPVAGRATVLASGINFANGVAVSPDQAFVLVNETGSYRVLRVWVAGPLAGLVEPLAEGLPGFPDNISVGLDGRFWVALVSPRDAVLDRMAGRPFLRKVVQRLPASLRPGPKAYGHVIAIDRQGTIVADLQDPRRGYPLITSAVETRDHLYLGSLVASSVGRVPRARLDSVLPRGPRGPAAGGRQPGAR